MFQKSFKIEQMEVKSIHFQIKFLQTENYFHKQRQFI